MLRPTAVSMLALVLDRSKACEREMMADSGYSDNIAAISTLAFMTLNQRVQVHSEAR